MKTNVYILLDRSGSMQDNWKETIGSLNAYAENVKIDGNIMVAAFDTQSYDVIRNVSPEMWKNISMDEVTPRGMTPLLDASARIMHYALDTKSERAIIVILTDGEENNSKHFTKPVVNRITEEVKSKGYEIIFLGANFDKIGEVAQTLGSFNADKFMNMNQGTYVRSMNMLAEKTMAYASAATDNISFSDEDKAKGKT